MKAIQLEQVYKSYSGLAVLRGLNLQVEQNEIYGLLGPNGSGKSTLMQLLVGFLRPERGAVRVLGTSDLARNQGAIGYVPGQLRFPLAFSAREYLRLLGGLDDLREPMLSERIASELDAVGLSEAADRTMSGYSRGMLQRVGIAQALLHNPKLLLIDEPTGGLDPLGQRDVLSIVADVRQRGCSVLLATHYLDEIEQVCDRVGILYQGQIAAEFPVAALHGPGHKVQIIVDDLAGDASERLRMLSSAVQIDKNRITIEPNSQALQARVLQTLLDAGATILALEPRVRKLAALYDRVTSGQPFANLLQPILPSLVEISTLPNGLFAPPGHPDAVPVMSDPLLNELLNQGDS